MKRQLLELLRSPGTMNRLELSVEHENADGSVQSGELRSQDGETFAITDGIPRFVPEEQYRQTADSFRYKWHRQSAYEDESVKRMIEHDEAPRWGFDTIEQFRELFHGPKTILDAGCGSGHFASIYAPYVNDTNTFWVGTDLTTAIDLAQRRFDGLPNAGFVQGNILDLPYADEVFDTVICRGVMHHTPDQWGAFRSLVRTLKPGGEFVFLIYRKMGPIREFTDDYVRSVVSALEPEAGWEALKPLTDLGKALSDLAVTVDVPTDIPFLDIPKGTYDVHELIYNHFLKAFWSKEQGLADDYVYDYSMHNTFDWYHPEFATKATEADIRAHCEENGLELTFIRGTWTSWAVRCTKPR